ncbi:MAG: ATP synthase F1 subunit epsilon [Planctomycetota bacterium]
MANTFRCTIVTPDDAVFDGELSYASFPAWDGQHGMIGGQSPLLTRLGVGACRLDRADGGREWFLVAGGFAQVQGTTLTILTESAVASDELSIDEANTELTAANNRVGKTGEDIHDVVHAQQVAMAKKQVAAIAGQR